MTESKVVGRRVGFWRGTSPFLRVFIVVICPLCVILGARYLVSLRHVDHLFDHFGDYLVQSALAVVGVLMGPVGLITLQSRRHAYVIASACPSCGFEAERDFRDAERRNPWPVACGHCLAYLHVDPKTLRVREVRRDEATDNLTHYTVVREQYENIVARRDDADRHFAFAWPAKCAICCDPNASFLSDIGVADPDADWGITHAVFWRPYNDPARKMNAPVRPDEVVKAIRGTQTPACAQHKERVAVEHTALAALCFATYRYYKEFCELNGITVGPQVALEAAEAGLPQAVAQLAARKGDARDERSAGSGA